MPHVDVHHHFHSPRYVARHGDVLRRVAPAYAHVLERTPADSLRGMDEAGVDTAMLSLPGVWFADDLREGRDTARDLNEFAAEVRRDHAGRFGAFAVLPFPDVDGSLNEIAYAFDELQVDGVGVSSNYDGRHLADPAFAPLFDELDARGAVVYVHAAMMPGAAGAVPGLAPHALELPFDTARTIADLILRDAFTRWPRIRWIFSHGAGAFPALAHRVAALAEGTGMRSRREVLAEAASIRVDTASVGNGPAMAALREFLPTENILFGSDYPYVTPSQELAELRTVDARTAERILTAGGALFPGIAAR